MFRRRRREEEQYEEHSEDWEAQDDAAPAVRREIVYVYAGAPPPPRRRRWGLWRLTQLLLILLIWAGVLGGGALLWYARDLPRPEDALDAIRRPSLVLQDSAGRSFATYGDVVGEPLRLRDLPPSLPQAAVAVEDRRFWTHHGIDPRGLARAVFVNLTSGRVVQGGSTITQQVAKTLFLSNARTFKRKVQELLLTFWLEQHFTKQEILEIWLNRVYLGTGTYGADAAAHLYFGISARRLNLWQSAVIAGIPRAPSRFNPRTDPKAAAARGREVLQAMADSGAISQAAAKQAGDAIAFPALARAGGWFADWAAGEVASLVPQDTDAVLRTTLDERVQKAAETALASTLAASEQRYRVTQGAVVVLDAQTGAVRAMVGGRDYAQSPFNRAVAAKRQPGSSFKPFVWLAALEHGARPDDLVLDAPITIKGWSPQDFEPGFRGQVSLTQALALSLNTSSVRLMLQAGGPQSVIDIAHRLGVREDLPDLPSIALGTGEVSLLEMTAAYAAFFNGGNAVQPRAVASITANGSSTAISPRLRRGVIDVSLAGMMVKMMAQVVQSGTGRAAAIPGAFVAGKTGTTSDYRDAWFIGCVNGDVIGVWVGNDDASPMRGVMGGNLPARIFAAIARQ